jgi:hypothetical protein
MRIFFKIQSSGNSPPFGSVCGFPQAPLRKHFHERKKPKDVPPQDAACCGDQSRGLYALTAATATPSADITLNFRGLL